MLKAWLRGKQAPTALFCSNDLLATAVIADLVALGLRVPTTFRFRFDGMRRRLVDPAADHRGTTQRWHRQTALEHLLAQTTASPAPTACRGRIVVVVPVKAPGRLLTVTGLRCFLLSNSNMHPVRIMPSHKSTRLYMRAAPGRWASLIRHHRPQQFLAPAARAER